MKKFKAFLLIFVLCLGLTKAEVLGKESVPLEHENSTKNLYKEEKKGLVAVFNDKKAYYISNDDIFLMSQVVYAESRGEPYDGKVAVASVILNRLVSPDFPNSVAGVVKQKNAFSCVKNGKIDITPDDESYRAVLDALKGKDPTSKAVFFYNPKIATCSWMKNINKKNTKSIGNHVFFAVK
ncbi:cell wall hydrolase [Clostridium sp. KNHs214]|uniref:cell wall hydrolase n=1 Tax=Clostridium sp. KNHs214 TaxID=1540257 RepID=UPI00054DEC1B|nr:cell wall hydrolase [Clostridium sp. KNHs214]